MAILSSERNEKLETFYNEINNIMILLSNISVIHGFPQPFEQEFKNNFFEKNYTSLRLIIFFGIILYALYGFVDVITLPNWQMVVIIRDLIITPILCIIFALCFTPLYRKFQQFFAILSAIFIMIGLTTSAIIVPVHYKDMFYQSLSLVIFFLAILTALQFRYTLVLCVFLLLSLNVSYYYSGMDKTPYYLWGLIGNNYILSGAASVCVIVSYLSEMKLRREFLLQRLIQFKNNLLEYISRTDQVTGLGNRHHLEEAIASEWNRAMRYQYPLAVLFADFDYFKQYNDTYGHQIGDKALRNLGLAFSACVKRAGDFVGRYGGDEFMVILSNTSERDAIKIAKNIFEHIERLHLAHRTSPISDIVSLTMGIAIMTPNNENSAETLIKQADYALQNGKNMHRGKIYLYSDKNIKMVTETNLT